MSAEALQEAIEKLGYFVGEIGQHQFMARLLDIAATDGGGPGNPAVTISQWDAAQGGPTPVDPENAAFSKMVNALLGMNQGGTTVAELIEVFKAFVKDAKGGAQGVVDKLTSENDRMLTLTFKLLRI